MEKVAVRKKLDLKFEAPPGLKQLQQSLEDLHAFAAYYSLNDDKLHAYLEENLAERLNAYAQSSLGPEGSLIDENSEQETQRGQWLYNIRHVIPYLKEAGRRDLNLAFLQEIHTLLSFKLEYAALGGKLRSKQVNLFSFVEEDVLLPDSEELKSYLHDTLAFCADKKMPALVRAFAFYYVITAIKPFEHETEVIAILGANHILGQEKTRLFGLLNLEKHVFLSPKFITEAGKLFSTQNYIERLNSDISPFLELCLAYYNRNFLAVNQTLTNCVRNDFEFKNLTPRLKNNLNFWLEKAFYLHKDKLKDLTQRQHDILTLLGKYGQLATKDLVPVFKVDRKTIQRDFNVLQDLGLVEQRGGGRNMKYFFDYKIRI